MLKNIYFCITVYFAVLLLSITTVSAQNVSQQLNRGGLSPEVMAWTVSTMEPWPPGRYKSLNEAMLDNHIFIPLTFRGGLFPTFDYSFKRDSLQLFQPLPSPYAYRSRRIDNVFRYYLFKKSFDDVAYKQVMLRDPRNFRYRIQQTPKKAVKAANIELSKDSVKVAVTEGVTKPAKVEDVTKFTPDRRYWTSSCVMTMNFTQGKNTKKSYGGVDNLNLFMKGDINFNYARSKFSSTNTLNYNLTLQNAPNDTMRSYTVSSENLKYTGNLGLKAIGNWNYSISQSFESSFTRRYAANTMNKTGSFLTPYTISVGVGMTYNYNPKFKNPNKAVTIAASINPFNFTFKAARDRELYPTITRIKGSKIIVNANPIKLSKSISGWSRLTYDTNYEFVNVISENSFKIIISRYFNATIDFTLNYDDRIARVDANKTLLAAKESITFGFTYTWW
jgi:hypothetical protein